MSSTADTTFRHPASVSQPTTNTTTQASQVAAGDSTEVAKKKFKSDVWDHFTKIEKEDGSKADQCKCNYCSSVYACSSSYGTSTLRKHLGRCRAYPLNKDTKQTNLVFQKDDEEESKLVPWKFDQGDCREALAKMIMIDELSFRFVEREGFRLFMSVCQPRFQHVSRTTIARDVVKLYARLKTDLKIGLRNQTQRICLTTDAWTSIQNMSYMCLTAHFIDSTWKLQKRILNFSVLASHKGVAIGQAVEACLVEWGVEKVFTMTVDNASSNDTAIAHLKKKLSKKNAFVLDGEFFHMRCCAHILNLIVRDGVKEIETSIIRIRGVVRYIRSSPQRAQQFGICCDQEQIVSKSSLCLDVPTRWNYTFLMLETALKFQKAFERLDELETNFSFDLKEGVPSEEDWDNARVLTKFLKVFYDVTKRLSGSLYVTSNDYFHQVCAIEQLLSDWAKHSDIRLSIMAKKMKEKFDKYWGNIEKVNMMLLVAVVLDPRYKLKYVEFCYGRIYHLEKVNELSTRIQEVMHRMYIHYQMFVGTSSRSKNTQSSNDIEVDSLEGENGEQVKSLQSQFLKHLEERESVDSKSEVDMYFDEGVAKDGPNFDILAWWKLNGCRYPTLALVARDVLAIPVSTVASESAFITGGVSYTNSVVPYPLR